MVEYFQEDIEEAKNEALDAQKQLSERQIELENTNLSLSKAQKELLAINSTLEEQKRLISQKNAEIEELKALAEKSNEYKELLQNITESLCRGQLLREIIDGREKGIRCIIDLYKDPHARYFSEEQKQEIAEVIGEDKDLVRSYRAKELIIAASRFIISHGLEEDNHDKNIKGQIEAIVQGKEYREQKGAKNIAPTYHHNAPAERQHRLQQYPHKSCRAACFSCLISLTTYRASSSGALVFLFLFVGVLKVQGTKLLFSL